MRLGAALGFVAGVALTAWLLASYGVGRILDLLGHAEWLGIGAVVLAHLGQVLLSAAAWRSIAGPTTPRPGLRVFMVLRWIREGVNNLLPVAQIGGQVVAARLLRRRGVPLVSAIAGVVGDLTVEIVTQIAFTLLGLGLLLLTVGDGGISGVVIAALAVAAAAAGGFLGAQWLGLGRLVEAGLVRLGTVAGWRQFGRVEGLHDAITALYRSPRRVLQAASLHPMSWLLGGFEVWLALRVLGQDVSAAAGLVIESLGQVVKAASFAVPGAVGVQEGGYVVICRLFGLSPEVAIALSLVKRLREAVLGVPALAAWQWLEWRAGAARASLAREGTPR